MNHKIIFSLLIIFSSLSALDHKYPGYAQFLATYVAGGGVYYDKLSSKSEVIASLRNEFEAVGKKQFDSFSKKQQLAYLINVYNFYTIDLIVQFQPLKTGIRDIKDPWDRKFVPLFGKKVSLNHIEHELIRKNYTEPRIHFALVCASRSCPELLHVPFTAEGLDSLFDFSGKRFLTDTSKNRVEGNKIYLSKIFEWYGSDFNGSFKGGYLEYIGKVLGIDTKSMSIDFLPYDWGLNSAK